MVWLKAIAVWGLMAIAAIANGILRESVLTSCFGASNSLPISGVLLLCLIFTIIYFTSDWFAGRNNIFCLMLGVFWVGITLLFEFCLGYFVRGIELEKLIQVFNVFSGNLFVLVIAVVLVGPICVARFKKGR